MGIREQAKADMDRAKQDAERARLAYNQATKTFNEKKARYDRLAFLAIEEELNLARERERAQAEGNHAARCAAGSVLARHAQLAQTTRAPSPIPKQRS